MRREKHGTGSHTLFGVHTDGTAVLKHDLFSKGACKGASRALVRLMLAGRGSHSSADTTPV